MQKHFLFGVAFLLSCSGVAIADIPFSPSFQEAIRTIRSASVFSIDQMQEFAFYEKRNRPAAKRKKVWTKKERIELARKSYQNDEDFIASQRKNVTALTEEQTHELSAILLDAENYHNGSFAIGEGRICALDARSEDSAFTMVFTRSGVSIWMRGEHSNALLNPKGRERLLNWLKSIGMVIT
jgi:hypothetical protein